MIESKVVATERLRREGRWDESSRFRDEARAELRRKGVKRAEANDQAWDAMLAKYPPMPTIETPADGLDDVTLDSSGEESAACDVTCVDPDLARDTLWAYENLDNRTATMSQAPSRGAWGLLKWARECRPRFFEQMVPKAMTLVSKRQEAEPERKPVMLDSEEKLKWLDNYIEKLNKGCEKVFDCPSCSTRVLLAADQKSLQICPKDHANYRCNAS